jgi:hypothetical protein
MAVTPQTVSFSQSSRQAAGHVDSFTTTVRDGTGTVNVVLTVPRDMDEHVLPVDPGRMVERQVRIADPPAVPVVGLEGIAVRVVTSAVLDAGFEGAEAARVYRAIGDFTLAWAGWEAAFLALDLGCRRTTRRPGRGPTGRSAAPGTHTSGSCAINCRMSQTTTCSRPSCRCSSAAFSRWRPTRAIATRADK